MGGKTSTSTQQVSIPPEVLARYNAVNARAEQVAQTPFQEYTGQFVAPLTGTQQAGISGTSAAANLAQPFYGAGAGMTLAGAQNVGPLTPGQIAYYENPYIESVARPTYQALRQQQQEEMMGQTANAIRSGAFGGDRAGLVAANLARQQQLGTAQAMAPIYAQGYGQAVQTAAGQQGVVAQDLARQMAAGQQIAGLGTGAQQAALQGAQAQLAAGATEQQTQQADLTARYQQFLQERGYPFQVAQFLANIAMGTGALAGSTTTTQQPLPFFSDRRLKRNIEEIGKLKDGQKLYRYTMADGRTHIGLMADEVEKHHPEAVGLAGGYKTVDYRAATDDAARHKRAYGGGLAPSSEGGAVTPDMAGLGFARGGSPLDAEDMNAIMASQRQSLGPFAKSGLYGAGGSYPAISSYVPQAALPVPKLITAGGLPAQPSGGLSQAVQTGTNLANLAKMGIEAKREFSKEREPVGGRERRVSPQTVAPPSIPPASLEETSPSGVLGRAYGGAADTPYDDIKDMDYFPNEVLSSKTPSLARPSGVAPTPPKPMFDVGDFAKIAAAFMSSGGVAGRHGYQAGGSPELDESMRGTGLVPEASNIENRPMTPTERREYYTRLMQHETGNRNIVNPASGAGTEFQFLPSTYRDIRSRASNLNLPENMNEMTPEQKYSAADFFTSENERIMRNRLGRHASPAEMMLGHHFGGAGAATLLGMDPNTKFEDLGSDFWSRNFRAPYSNEHLVRINRLEGKTIGDIINRYNRLMADVVPSAVRQQPSSPAPAESGVAAASLPPAPQASGAESPRQEGGREQRLLETLQGASGEGGLAPEAAGPFERLASGLVPESVPREAQFWIPLLSGVGSMLASQSKTLPGAIGEGLVGGASGYLSAAKGLQDVAASKAEEQAKYAGIAGDAVRVDANGRTQVRVFDPRRNAYIFVDYGTFLEGMPNGQPWSIDPRDRSQIRSAIQQNIRTSSEPSSVQSEQGSPYNYPNQDILKNAENEARMFVVGGSRLPQSTLDQMNPFPDQASRADVSRNNKMEFNGFASALADMRETGLTAAGNPEVFRSVARAISSIARSAGLPDSGIASSSDIAGLEQAAKTALQMASATTSEAQQKSVAALREILSALPNAGISREGAARIMSMLYVANQREIDKDRFYRKVQDHVANTTYGKSDPRSINFVGRGLGDKFDSGMIRQYQNEKAGLERMYNSQIETSSGPQNAMSFLIKNYDKISRDPNWSNFYKAKFGNDILRYFGGQ